VSELEARLAHYFLPLIQLGVTPAIAATFTSDQCDALFDFIEQNKG
jgi:hypothetical protein